MQTPEEYEITLRVNALVKGLKKRRGYTKKDISQKLGIGLTTFNDYLNGVSSFKLGTLIKFASLCKLTLPDILDDTLEAKKLYSEDLADRANTGKNTLDFLAVALLLPALMSGLNLLTFVCVPFLILAILARTDIKHLYLSLIFVFVFCLEMAIFYPIKHYLFPHFNPFINNTIAFGIQTLSSLSLIYFTKNRIPISLRLTKGKVPKLLEYSQTDGIIYGLLLGYLAVNLGALIENQLRSLERIGVNAEFAKQFWEVTFFYDNFEIMKVTLIALTIVALYIGINIQKRQDRQSVVFQSQKSI